MICSYSNLCISYFFNKNKKVPYDQPKASEDMINAWISGELGEDKKLKDN